MTDIRAVSRAKGVEGGRTDDMGKNLRSGQQEMLSW